MTMFIISLYIRTLRNMVLDYLFFCLLFTMCFFSSNQVQSSRGGGNCIGTILGCANLIIIKKETAFGSFVRYGCSLGLLLDLGASAVNIWSQL